MMDILRDIDIKAIYHFNGDAFEVLPIDEMPSKVNVIEDFEDFRNEFDAAYEAILHYRNNVTCRIDSAKCCEGIFYRAEQIKKHQRKQEVNMKYSILLFSMLLFSCASASKIPSTINEAFIPDVGQPGQEWITQGDSYTFTSTKLTKDGCKIGILKTETGSADFKEELFMLEGIKRSHTIKVCPGEGGLWVVKKM